MPKTTKTRRQNVTATTEDSRPYAYGYGARLEKQVAQELGGSRRASAAPARKKKASRPRT